MRSKREVNYQSSGGAGFLGLLTIAFIVLKLTNFISWSWWWVLSPIWIGAALWVVALATVFLVGVFAQHRGRR